MAGWDRILQEIQSTPGSYEAVRLKYLQNLYKYTGRNIIAYYSSFLFKPTARNIDINDSDMTGFMNALQNIDSSKGLDLILHTPGGNPTAAESIVKYLRAKFNNDIRVIVPHMAMSAGTMIACCGSCIIMGKHSSLGPVDPQINGIPAYDIVRMYLDAKREISSGQSSITYWKLLLDRYPAPFIYTAASAITLSSTLVKEWLGTCMFDANTDRDKIDKIANKLNEHASSKLHNRHFDISYCKKIGLKIQDLEADQDLQDAVLSLHHAYMLTTEHTKLVKIIENQNGKAFIVIQ